MMPPRLEIDLRKIHHNAQSLVQNLSRIGIDVVGVTKAVLGSSKVVHTLLDAGVKTLGDSRIENIEAMRAEGGKSLMELIRSPEPSQTERVVAHVDTSFNTELEVIRLLSSAARRTGKMHGVLLMVELGDLREGIMPQDLAEVVDATLRLPNITLRGLGTNLACLSGVVPNQTNMSELSSLANEMETTFGVHFDTISGGNSGNLTWALGGHKRRADQSAAPWRSHPSWAKPT